MKTLVKILLLSVAIVAAVFGVLLFQKTIAQPPLELEFDNQFIPSVKADIESISASEGFDTLFVSIYGDIKFLAGNKLIDSQASEKLTSDLFSAYVPVFNSRCVNYFNKPEWEESTLNDMSKHATYLTKESKWHQQSHLSAEDKESLSEISTVVANYYRAKKAIYVGSYSSLEQSKIRIKEAKDCLNLPYISNCSKLESGLKSVPQRLNDKHYAYLDMQVERLNDYKRYSTAQFDTLYKELAGLAKEYNDKAKGIYGLCYDLNELGERAAHYYERANKDSNWIERAGN